MAKDSGSETAKGLVMAMASAKETVTVKDQVMVQASADCRDSGDHLE